MRPRRRLLLARDPLGVKPLHVYQDAHRVAFASEIKSLLALPDVAPDVNRQALHDFMNVRYVPAPATLFDGVRRLEPGHVLVIEDGRQRRQRYFDWNCQLDHDTSADQWKEKIAAATRCAVQRQLMSDVPLGVYLSGGLDSSAIVAMMNDLGVEGKSAPSRSASTNRPTSWTTQRSSRITSVPDIHR